MLGGISDGRKIELRENAVSLAAVLKLRRRQSLRDQWLRGPKAAQHVESGRVKRRSARLFAEIRPGFEHLHRHAIADEIGGGDEANRPRAGDEDALIDRHWICGMPA